MDVRPEEGRGPERISRRRMLKRIGAGAAIAWSAPVLTSLRTPAFAQYGRCTECSRCFSCGDFGGCPTGTLSPVCAGGIPPCDATTCLCAFTTEGGCFCFANVFGTGGPCTSNATCPGSERCVVTCSQGCQAAFCLPPCGTAAATTQAGNPGRAS